MIENEDQGRSGRECLPSPAWMRSALTLCREAADFAAPADRATSEAFAQRSRDAASLALAIARLRRQQEQAGFVPVSWEQYLRGLANCASVALRPILVWSGVPSTACLDEEVPISGLARLARALGVKYRQLLLHLRIGFAERNEGAPVTMLLAGRRPAGRQASMLDDCEEVLCEIEQRYGPQARSYLQRMEEALRSAYRVEDAELL